MAGSTRASIRLLTVFYCSAGSDTALTIDDELPDDQAVFALEETPVADRAGTVGVKTDGFAEACPVQRASLVVLVHFEGGLWAVHKVTFPAVLPFIGACTFVAGTT